MSTPPPPPKGGLSLYDNLFDPNEATSSAVISAAPVLYNQNDGSAQAKKPLDASLRFQPIPRPQAKQAKPKTSFPRFIPKAAATPTSTVPQKNTLADWKEIDDDDWMYTQTENRQRGGRKNKKKKKQEEQSRTPTDWNDIYDPSKPTNVSEYDSSYEKVEEVREWKKILYRHKVTSGGGDSSDEEEGKQPAPSSQFAPPPSYSFVPPSKSPSPQPETSTKDDAHAGHFASQFEQSPQPGILLPSQSSPSTQDQLNPPESNATIISRPPVRFTQASKADADKGEEEDDEYSPPPTLGLGSGEPKPEPESEPESKPSSRSARPGQFGFAHRLMSKYGWTEGTGLGADESGIVKPLSVQIEKRRKKADADGGGWAGPGGKGKIIGGKRKGEGGKFGKMSEVILLKNMLDDMVDLQAEVENGLGQEIGEECGEKYGRVERLYIDQENRQVFIKFTDQISALRAVNELEGRVFNGNTIIPKFYDLDDFEQGSYTALQ